MFIVIKSTGKCQVFLTVFIKTVKQVKVMNSWIILTRNQLVIFARYDVKM